MNKIRPPRLVTVAIFTTVTVVFWVFFSVYRILTSQPDIDLPENILRPIDPSLNTKVLEQLPGRLFVEEGQERPFPYLPSQD